MNGYDNDKVLGRLPPPIDPAIKALTTPQPIKETHSMPKQNQRKTIGSITDFQSAIPHTPETTDERLDRLERGLTQVESLLNDVMQQLDRPYQDPLGKQNGKPSQAKQKPKSKPVKPSSPKQAKQKPPPIQPTPSHSKADIQAVTEFLEQHGDRLWHGNKLRKAIKDGCEGISNKRLKSVFETLRKDGKITIVANVEVDGVLLKGAYQFTP